MAGILSPLTLESGAGLLNNTGIKLGAELTSNVAAYQETTLVSTLLDINAEIANAALSAPNQLAIQTLGNSICPALGDSVPTAYANTDYPVPSVTNYLIPANSASLFSGIVISTGNAYLGNGDVGKFAQLYFTANGFVNQANQFINSAVNVNSSDYLGPTFTTQNNLITSDISQINLAFEEFATDLTRLGNAIDLQNLPGLGTPASLLQQLSKQGNMPSGTLPAIRTALYEQGLTYQDILNLVTNNVQSLFNPDGLTTTEFDALQKKTYPAFKTIVGTDLTDVLEILEITTPNLESMADLLNPVKMLPNSYASLTLPGPSGPILVYDNQGNLNSTLAELLRTPSLAPVGCDELSKIIPPDQSAGNKALQAALQQVTGISNTTLPVLANTIASLETLKDLPLINSLNQPLSACAESFYANTFAQGNGPNGTYLLTDFIGIAIGTGVSNCFSTATTIINSATSAGTLAYLQSIYDNMLGSVNSTFGNPVTGPVTIPSGPGTGVYADANAAITALVPLANAEISNVSVVLGAQTTTLNDCWDSICDRIIYEAENQDKAGIVVYELQANNISSVMSLVSSLPTAGTDTQEGMSAQVLQDLADQDTREGQAMVGSMREGRNNAALDASGVARYNSVPDLPVEEPPQADLGDTNYSVPEARTIATEPASTDPGACLP